MPENALAPNPSAKRRLIELMRDLKVISRGHFVLKSGAQSEIFFNCGNLLTAEALSLAGQVLGERLLQVFDTKPSSKVALVAAAYKGIPLALATAQYLYSNHRTNLPVVIIRKEQKDHGEGGWSIGRIDELTHDSIVVVIDDVFSSGTALQEVSHILQSRLSLMPKCALVLLNRSTLQPSSLASLQFPVHATMDANEVIAALS